MRKRLIPLFLFLLLSIFFVVLSQNVSTPFYFIAHIVSPVRESLYKSVYASGRQTEFDVLKAENLKLKTQLVELNVLKNDNAALRDQFKETLLAPTKLLPANIIGFKGSVNFPTTLVLNQGSQSGVKNGQGVVLGQVLLGKIGKVTNWSSELILTVSKNFSTLGVISENNSPGIITGAEEFILFDHVAITDTISKGNSIVTKGEVGENGASIPPNLMIGTVIAVNKSETSTFQSAILKSPIDARKLSTVFVVQ